MRFLRGLIKTLVVLLLVVLIPILVWWIPNRIDEKPTLMAQQWLQLPKHTVPDADNAWLYMQGLGAAENDDPVALGRRRVDAYEAREKLVQRPPMSAEQAALDKDALPFQFNVEDKAKTGLDCAVTDRDCIAWALRQSAELAKLEQTNSVRLQRLEKLIGMTGFEEVSTPSSEQPIPAIVPDGQLFRDLILRDLSDVTRRGDALSRLMRAIAFYRLVDEQAQSLEMKGAAERWLTTYASLLDSARDHFRAGSLDPAFDDAMASVLQAPTVAQRDFELPLRRRAIGLMHELSKTILGPIDTLRYCKSTPKNTCLTQWLMAQAYEPQATANLLTRFLDVEWDMYKADPRDLPDVQKRFGTLWEENSTLSDSMKQNLHAMAYNFTGKVLVLIAWPGMSEIFLRHDREARRRMFLIKTAALKQGVLAQDMPAFLATQPDALRNPYTGEPFAWNAAFSEMHFEPKSKSWQREDLAVPYPAPVKNPVVLCNTTLHIRLYGDVKSSGAANVMQVFSCAAGMRNAMTGMQLISPVLTDKTDDGSFGLMLGHEFHVRGIGVAETAGKIDVRVYMDDGGTWRGYAAEDVDLEDTMVMMHRVGHDAGPEFFVSITRVPEKALQVQARDIPIRQLAEDIARAAQIRVHNIDLLPATNITEYLDSVPASEALDTLIGSSGLELKELGEKRYAFQRTVQGKAAP
jgi:hypothetical protein